jgi:ornithine decarboxylase
MKDLIKQNFCKEDFEKLKTPQFLYFHSQTEQNIKDFRKFAKNKIEILYAIKANNYPKLIDAFVKEGYGFEVASIEELNFLLKQGANPKRISFSSPSKLVSDLKQASSKGVQYYAFDSEVEAEKIMNCVKNPLLVARVSTPSKHSVFDLSSKYGFDDKGYISFLKKAQEKKWPIKGLTFHVGSQNNALGAWRQSLKKMKDFIELTHGFGFTIDYLNLGGGIPAKYNGRTRTVDYYIDGICDLVKELRKKYRFKRVFIEPGRALSANTMVLVTEVIDLKQYKNPPIAIVDTSVFTGIIEPLEHFEYPIVSLDQIYKNPHVKTTKFYKLGGNSRDGYDIIHKKIALPKDLDIGNKLVILYAGAYTFVYEKFHMKSYAKIADA